LADRLEGRLPNAGALLPLRAGILAHLTERAEESRFPLTPQRIVHDVRHVTPDIVCLDNGMYKIWFARNYRTQVANTLLLDNALATMGAGLPSAMMAAMLYPKRRVLAVSGDGGFMMNAQELETAVRLRLTFSRCLPSKSSSYFLSAAEDRDQPNELGVFEINIPNNPGALDPELPRTAPPPARARAALRRIAGFFRPGVRGVSALAAGLRCERVIARKAALAGIDTLSALSPSLSRQSPILRKTALFVRDACAALPRNRKLFFSIHRGKASG
jgi:hypothetical protein